MCGRYLALTEDEIIEYREIINEVNEKYKNTELLASMAKGEVFPTNIAPVLAASKADPQAALMKWGFPKYQGAGVIINARAETILEKRMFQKSLMERRCVVPTAGFFEWRQEAAKKKTKYLFRLPHTKLLYLAGIYGRFTEGGVPYDAYVIITTAATPSVASYHDRMPLILEAEQIKPWLADTSFALEHLQSPSGAILQALQSA